MKNDNERTGTPAVAVQRLVRLLVEELTWCLPGIVLIIILLIAILVMRIEPPKSKVSQQPPPKSQTTRNANATPR